MAVALAVALALAVEVCVGEARTVLDGVEVRHSVAERVVVGTA